MKDLIRGLPLISNRDSWRFIIESKYGDTIFDINSKDGSIENEAIKDDLEPYLNEQVGITYIILKRLSDNILTVYEESLFAEYLQQYSVNNYVIV